MILKPASSPPSDLHIRETTEGIVAIRPKGRVSHRKSHRISPWLLILLIIVLMIALDRFFNPHAFPVQRINVSGELKQIKVENVLAIVKPMAEGNLFAVNLEQIETAVESIPWVAKATVRRRWPEELAIHLVENRAAARWRGNAWMNTQGKIFDLPAWTGGENLPRLAGSNGSHERIFRRFRQWSRLLVMTGLRIRELRLNERDDWVMQVSPLQRIDAANRSKGGKISGFIQPYPNITPSSFEFSIYLGKEDLESHLLRFSRVFKGHLINRAQQIKGVDLRYPNGFAIAWSESGTSEAKQTESQDLNKNWIGLTSEP